MITQIIILFLEIFFLFAGTSVLVIGQPLPTLFSHKWQTFKHWYSMFGKIHEVAPNKTLARLSWAFIIAFIVYCLLTKAAMQDNTIEFGSWNFPSIVACINILAFFVSIITLVFTDKKKKQERDWREVRISAHRRVYRKYPDNHREYSAW